MKFRLFSSGVIKFLVQVPAVVTEVSWPSEAVLYQRQKPCRLSPERLTHIGGDEHPLGELVVRQVLVEHGEVLDVCQTIWVLCHGFVDNRRIWILSAGLLMTVTDDIYRASSHSRWRRCAD